MANQKIDLSALEIFPLSKDHLKIAFKDETPPAEFKHLINWLKTAAWHSQLERKSKTYLASYEGRIVAYISISNGKMEEL